MPVFFPIGSVAQLIFGLIICFVTFGAYSFFEPYANREDNHLALMAQAQIFFCMLSSIGLKFDSYGLSANQNMDALLLSLTVILLAMGIFLETPLKHLVYKSERDRLTRVARKLTRKLTKGTVGVRENKNADPPTVSKALTA